MPVHLKVLFFLIAFVLVPLARADYSGNPQARALIDELVANENFDRAELEKVLAQAERKDNILEAISRPAEKTKPWYEYRAIFVTDQREEEGIAFYQKHRETFARAEAELGVPQEMILAIIGVETYYGRIAGSYRVLDALATLAFDYPRRSEFFTSELRNYLILTRDQGFDPTVLKGSYAGAMGYGQFMPSSYREYAIDFDGDGVVDIWNNPVDAIGSVANYFKRHGWQPGEPVVFAADSEPDVPPEVFVNSRADLKPTRTVGQFRELGVTPRQEVAPDALATAMKFEVADGYEYWLGVHNFYVITRYNLSAMYAMSVYQLSQNLARRIEGLGE